MNIVWTIAIRPMGKERVRFARGRARTPDKTREWMRLVGEAVARQPRPDIPHKMPLRVDVVAILPRVKAHNFRYKRTGKLKFSAGLIPCSVKPDRDNIDKIVLDALKDVFQDSRVQFGIVAKYHCELHGHPRVIVRITDKLPDPLKVIREATSEISLMK